MTQNLHKTHTAMSKFYINIKKLYVFGYEKN